MRFVFFYVLPFFMGIATTTVHAANSQVLDSNPIELSIALLENTLNGLETNGIEEEIAQLDSKSLGKFLDNDEKKKTFWINIYNSYVIIFLSENPELFEDRGSFFSNKRINVAGDILSFDDIEHGFIRRSKVKLGLGLVNNPFAGDLEKRFRVDKVDPRIHFALNCGAASCPPVRIYKAETIDQQLENAAKQYLTTTTKFNQEDNKVMLTTLMSWFRGDFGGKSGALDMVKKFKLIPQNAKPSVEYLSYDWTLDIQNFIK